MNRNSVRFILSLVATASMTITGFGLSEQAVEDYIPVATGRAQKIVDAMELQDAQVKQQLVGVIAGQYKSLFILHELRDEALKSVSPFDHGFDTFKEGVRVALEKETEAAVDRLHRSFVTQVAALVGDDGLEAVKNGMTYNVAPNTYKVYMQMIPDLSAEGKTKIKGWLWEAREYAMDKGSSDEKHKTFGKYKGRINNYLSSLGYDLKQAERDMWARLKNEKDKK